MSRILCLGMSALDAIYRVPAIPATPTKVLATAFTECGGGMAANASVAVARLGGQASYWGRVGTDALGTRILDQLSAEGVDVAAVRRIAGCVSPSAAILVADDGERLVCAYNDPKLDPDASWLPLDQVPTFDAVLADVRWPAGAAAVLDAARAAQKPAVFDGDIGPRDALLDLARRASHVVFSEPGLAHVAGTSAPGDGLAWIAQSVRGSSASRWGRKDSSGSTAARSAGCPLQKLPPSTRSRPGMSGTALLRWPWPSGAMSRKQRDSPTLRRP